MPCIRTPLYCKIPATIPVLTEKKADIEQFEKYITAITRMFMGSLEDNQNITETVRTEFDALLTSKDAVIRLCCSFFHPFNLRFKIIA